MLSPRVGIGGRLLRCVRGQVSNMSLLVSVSSRVLRHFIAVSSLSSTIHVGGWKVICHKLHLRGWLLSCGRWDETLRVCAVYYCDAYTDTHPYILLTNSAHTDTHPCTLHRGLARRGSGFCQQCPMFMQSLPGSTNISDCSTNGL